MRKTKNFTELHKRITILGEPVWICISPSHAGKIPIGQFTVMCEYGLIAYSNDDEREEFNKYNEYVDSLTG
jgi:hypothetical protein